MWRIISAKLLVKSLSSFGCGSFSDLTDHLRLQGWSHWPRRFLGMKQRFSFFLGQSCTWRRYTARKLFFRPCSMACRLRGWPFLTYNTALVLLASTDNTHAMAWHDNEAEEAFFLLFSLRAAANIGLGWFFFAPIPSVTFHCFGP